MATTLTIDAQGNISEKTYWQPSAQRTDLSDQAYLDKTHELIIKAVDKRMLAAHVPIGVLLSGGLDSSLLVGLLHARSL
jgi:asparagine synthase (glutamine-hydrolysing)